MELSFAPNQDAIPWLVDFSRMLTVFRALLFIILFFALSSYHSRHALSFNRQLWAHIFKSNIVVWVLHVAMFISQNIYWALNSLFPIQNPPPSGLLILDSKSTFGVTRCLKLTPLWIIPQIYLFKICRGGSLIAVEPLIANFLKYFHACMFLSTGHAGDTPTYFG